MPRLVILGNYPPPYGGVPRQVADLAAHMCSSGWEVHVFPAGHGESSSAGALHVHRDARRLPRRVFDVVSFYIRLCRRGKAWWLLKSLRIIPVRRWLEYSRRASFAAYLFERHHISVIKAYNLLSGAPVGQIMAAAYDVPLIVTNLGEIYSNAAGATREQKMIKEISKQAAALISVSCHCARSYAQLGVNAPVKIYRHGVDLTRFRPDETNPDYFQRLGLKRNDRIVLYVGRLLAEMGVDTLLDAIPRVIAQLPAARFIIGGARGELHNQAVSTAHEFPGKVWVLIDVPDEELAALFCTASIVVAPTKGDRACGSLAAAQAMACRKPVIASRVGGIPEIVGDGTTGLLVPPDDPGALGEAILELLLDPVLCEKFGDAGLERARADFDVSAINSGLEEVIVKAMRVMP